jgi:hypothetical protein
MSDDLKDVVEELRKEQKEIVETLRFLRSEAEHAHKIREEAIALQRTANQRVRRVGTLAFFGILACVFLIVYLVTKYRILF